MIDKPPLEDRVSIENFRRSVNSYIDDGHNQQEAIKLACEEWIERLEMRP